MSGIQLEGIRKSFPAPGGAAVEVLRGIDLTIAPGECFSLLGASGCGKTTLLRILAGLETPDAGRVLMDGADVTALAPERRPTALVFQNYALFPHLTVEGNVAFGLKTRKLPGSEIRERTGRALERVQLAGLGGRRVSELSGGQQQRVALARVLAIEPAVILMDEPLSNLDAALRRSTRSMIRRLQRELGLTLVYVTHDQEEALMISDRLALMEGGWLAQVGTPGELFDRPATAEAARFLGERNVIAAYFIAEREGRLAIALAADAEATLAVPASGAVDAIQPGDPVWLAARPDEIEIETGGDGAQGWPARLILRSHAGARVEFEMELEATGEPVRALLPAASDHLPTLQSGSLAVALRPGAGLVYHRET